MTPRLLLEAGLWACTAACGLYAVVALAQTTARSVGESTGIAAAPSVERDTVSADSLASAVAYVTGNDPFRSTHQPATVAFGAPVSQPGYSVPSSVRPELALRGIVGVAPHWSALLAGIPSHDQIVIVHPGDSIGSLRIRGITGSEVIVQGPDTTWHLVLKAPWQ